MMLDAAFAWNRVPFVGFQHLPQFHSSWQDQYLNAAMACLPHVLKLCKELTTKFSVSQLENAKQI